MGKYDESDLISIIVPVYNVEEYLSQCIASIVEQSYENLEIILIDDGSQDRSGQICDEWKMKDDRITVLHQKNQGVSEARNIALGICNGRYVQFVDSDDILNREMVGLLHLASVECNADVAVCRISQFEDRLVTDTYKGYTVNKQENHEEYLYHFTDSFAGNIGGPTNKLYKRDVIDTSRFDRNKKLEDYVFNAKVARKVKRAVWIDEQLYYYRQRAGSIMHDSTTYQYYPWAYHEVWHLLANEGADEFRRDLGFFTLNFYGYIETEMRKKQLSEYAALTRQQFLKDYPYIITDLKGSRRIVIVSQNYFPTVWRCYRNIKHKK